jgi:hypothetical protein
VPWREKLNTVSNARYWKQVQRINPADIRVLATNKAASNLLMHQCGIPTPTIHGVLDRERGSTFDGAQLRDASDLRGLIVERSLVDICFKPIDAWSGGGFVKVSLERDGDDIRAHVLPAGPDVTLEGLCNDVLGASRFGGYLIQDVLEQHPDVARFHPSSLNTMRTWMHQPRPGRWEMYCANLRMGVNGMTIDNSSAGGIAAPIDVATGRMGPALLRGNDPDHGATLKEYASHPTTGVRIDGEVLPMWPDVLALCRRTAETFPFAFMAVDVGMGREHPWIVEVEADPHSFIQLYCVRGLRPMLQPLLKRRA